MKLNPKQLAVSAALLGLLAAGAALPAAPFLPRLPSPSRGALWRLRAWKQGTMPPP